MLAAVVPFLAGWILLRFVFGGRVDNSFTQESGGTNYLGFLAIGLATYMNMTGVLLAVGRSLITEQREGTLDALFLTPVSRIGYTLGYTFYQLLLQVPPTIALFVIAWLSGAQIQVLAPGAVLVNLVMAVIGFYGMSLVLASVMLAIRETFITQNTLTTALYVFSGILFPVGYLPKPLRFLSEGLPSTRILHLLRNAWLYGLGPRDLPADYALTAMVALGFLLLGIWLLRHVERLALADMTW